MPPSSRQSRATSETQWRPAQKQLATTTLAHLRDLRAARHFNQFYVPEPKVKCPIGEEEAVRSAVRGRYWPEKAELNAASMLPNGFEDLASMSPHCIIPPKWVDLIHTIREEDNQKQLSVGLEAFRTTMPTLSPHATFLEGQSKLPALMSIRPFSCSSVRARNEKLQNSASQPELQGRTMKPRVQLHPLMARSSRPAGERSYRGSDGSFLGA